MRSFTFLGRLRGPGAGPGLCLRRSPWKQAAGSAGSVRAAALRGRPGRQEPSLAQDPCSRGARVWEALCRAAAAAPALLEVSATLRSASGWERKRKTARSSTAGTEEGGHCVERRPPCLGYDLSDGLLLLSPTNKRKRPQIWELEVGPGLWSPSHLRWPA